MRTLCTLLAGLAAAALLSACDTRDPVNVPSHDALPEVPAPGTRSFAAFVKSLIADQTKEDNEPASLGGVIFGESADPADFASLFP
jgi:hypothetical protein